MNRPTGSPPKPPSPVERQAAALEAQTETLQRLLALAESAEAERFRINREVRDNDRRREELGRGYVSEPKRLSFLAFARVVPGLAAVFSRKIPTEFWSLDSDVATVACPCGGEPKTTLGIPHFCEGESCERAYLFDGANVRVAFSPTQTPAPA